MIDLWGELQMIRDAVREAWADATKTVDEFSSDLEELVDKFIRNDVLSLLEAYDRFCEMGLMCYDREPIPPKEFARSMRKYKVRYVCPYRYLKQQTHPNQVCENSVLSEIVIKGDNIMKIENRIVYKSQMDAQNVLNDMRKCCEKYGFVTVQDMYDLSGIEPSSLVSPKQFYLSFYGWLKLSGASIIDTKHGFVLYLPDPEDLHPLEKDKSKDIISGRYPWGSGDSRALKSCDIKGTIGDAAAYEQLAEECTELAQAALKKARLLRGENPVRKTEDEIDKNLIEEFSDLILSAYILGLEADSTIMKAKEKRWSESIVNRNKPKSANRILKNPALTFVGYRDGVNDLSRVYYFVDTFDRRNITIKAAPAYSDGHKPTVFCWYSSTLFINGEEQQITDEELTYLKSLLPVALYRGIEYE